MCDWASNMGLLSNAEPTRQSAQPFARMVLNALPLRGGVSDVAMYVCSGCCCPSCGWTASSVNSENSLLSISSSKKSFHGKVKNI
jgi:hypothetical protein